MNLIPVLKIGLWNAWIPILFFNLSLMIFSYIVSKKGFKRGADKSWIGKKEKPVMALSFFSWCAILIFSVWVPLEIGTLQFYAGMIVYMIGLLLSAIVSMNFVTAPLNNPLTQGMYKLSRHPIYFFNYVCILGVCIASFSWILFVLLAIYSILNHFVVIAEEKHCLEKYGDSYCEYMNLTPRYIGIPKAEGRK